MYQYRIEKDRLPITIKLDGGDCIEGHIFVQPSVYRHLGREEAIDLLNAPEPFFPIVGTDGSTLLIAKDRVMEAWPVQPDEDEELRLAGTREALLELVLVDGTVRSGTIPLELPSDRPRLLDFLNSHSERFLALHAADAIHLINTRVIKCIRPLD